MNYMEMKISRQKKMVVLCSHGDSKTIKEYNREQ